MRSMEATKTCLNCQNPLQPTHLFCCQCGQQATVHRLSSHDISHGLFHYFLHADRSVFGLLKGLATRPGVVAYDYIAGRRKHWFNPYTFFLLCVSIFVLIYVAFGSFELPLQKINNAYYNTLSAAAKQQYLDQLTRSTQVQIFSRKHSNLLSLMSIPFVGFVLWMVLRKKGLNYFETITALMYFRGFTTLAISLLFAPLLGFFVRNFSIYMSLVSLSQLLTAVYISWAFWQLLQQMQPMRWYKLFLLCIAANLLWLAVSVGIFNMYILQNYITF